MPPSSPPCPPRCSSRGRPRRAGHTPPASKERVRPASGRFVTCPLARSRRTPGHSRCCRSSHPRTPSGRGSPRRGRQDPGARPRRFREVPDRRDPAGVDGNIVQRCVRVPKWCLVILGREGTMFGAGPRLGQIASGSPSVYVGARHRRPSVGKAPARGLGGRGSRSCAGSGRGGRRAIPEGTRGVG